MRTTLVLDDVLVIKAKQLAAQDHRTFSDVVNQALRDLVNTQNKVREAPVTYRALTYGDSSQPVAMEPNDLNKLNDDDDINSLGY